MDPPIWTKHGILAPKNLMTIARRVGIPLQIDQATRDMKYGFYARILVEVNPSKPLLDFVTVKLPDFGFDVEVHYENLPPKCNSCNKFDHADHQCWIKKNPNTQHTSKVSDPKQKFKPTQSKPQEKLNRMINDNGLNSKKDSLQTAYEETKSPAIVAENSNGKRGPSNQHQIGQIEGGDNHYTSFVDTQHVHGREAALGDGINKEIEDALAMGNNEADQNMKNGEHVHIRNKPCDKDKHETSGLDLTPKENNIKARELVHRPQKSCDNEKNKAGESNFILSRDNMETGQSTDEPNGRMDRNILSCRNETNVVCDTSVAIGSCMKETQGNDSAPPSVDVSKRKDCSRTPIPSTLTASPIDGSKIKKSYDFSARIVSSCQYSHKASN
ncbi:Zinc knuckle CX2CX4HX4C [Melia azedarach]|uniref:Zinc knuckle CX2CX4HX4C n=1 Tax=Melia azedarach TaxID=155640 RepID=A0ACC1XW49_MELAZ|nr:Zinc knuckle CX2CX4HX4C [Melia azedarach]